MNVATEPAGGFRLSLATSVFLLFAILLGLALGAAIWVTWQRGDRIAAQAVQDKLDVSAAVQAELTERRLEEVQLKVQLIAADPSFVKYVNDSLGGGLGLGTDSGLDIASINDLLRERQSAVGFDLGLVTDAEGNVLARTDQLEAFDQNMADDAFLASALAGPSPISGFWREGAMLYQAAAWPLDLDGDLVGFMLVALRVDDALSVRVGKASGADIAFLLPIDQRIAVIGTSLDPTLRVALDAAIAVDAGGMAAAIKAGTRSERMALELDGQSWIGQLAPVDSAGGGALGATLRLSSADRAAAGYREILNLLALAGGVVLLIALPLSFLLAKTTLRPLATMASAAKEAAAGNYQTRIGIRGRDALAQLSQAFDSLLSDLREKSDIEGYVTNLSRFLPDPGSEAAPGQTFVTRDLAERAQMADPARQGAALLLGLDLRGLARAGADGAAPAVALAEQRVAGLLAAATAQHGRLVSGSGARLVFAFDTTDRLARALAVAREAIDLDHATAAGLLEGVLVEGAVRVPGGSLKIGMGTVCHQLDRLLVEAAAGKVLLPKGLGESARGLLAGEALPVQAGLASGKSFYALDAQALARLVAPLPLQTGGGDSLRTVEHPRAANAPTPSRASRQAPLLPGMRFGGRYDILGVLGEGGMGVVYKARDLELDDVVALKMLKPAALGDSEHLDRLKSEIRLARKITHPNVLRTFDFGDVDGRPYISMEYVRGMTLRYLIKQTGRIPYSAALRIARQLSAGLAAAHQVGVLHRDIKPENLILESSGNAKLMDFGIARPLHRSEPGHTQPGMFVGTPAYSSPEQLSGGEVDARSDVYASGVLMCEMFCGKVPFQGASTMEIYLAQMQREPIKPSAWWPEVPPALEALILRCIEREPAARIQSAIDLNAGLAGLRA